MKLKYELSIQKVGERYVAVAINEDAAKYSGMIKLNETGKRIVELLAKDTTAEEVVKTMQSEFDGDAHTIEVAVMGFISNLREQGLLAE